MKVTIRSTKNCWTEEFNYVIKVKTDKGKTKAIFFCDGIECTEHDIDMYSSIKIGNKFYNSYTGSVFYDSEKIEYERF